MSVSRKSTRHAEIYRHLVQRIAVSQPNEQIPTVAELKKEFGVSQITVTEALRRLQQKGLIRRNLGRKRYVVAQNTPLTQASVAVLRPSWPSPEYDSLMNALQRECTRRRWMLELIHYQDWNEIDLVRLIDEHQGLFSIGTPSDVPASHEEHILKLQFPFVTMMGRIGQGLLSGIEGDDLDLGRSAVTTLRKLGHRRIAVFLNEPNSITIERRLQGWTEAMQDAGETNLSNLVINCSVRPGQNSIELGSERLNRWMDRRHEPFTAIFATAWTGALAVMRVMHDRNVDLPGECSLLAQGGLWPIGQYLVPPLSTIDYDSTSWAEAACELLGEQMNTSGTAPRLIKLPSQVHLRGTTARLKR